MTNLVPANPSIEHLKKQAKDLLKYLRMGDGSALEEARKLHPRATNLQRFFTLADAQLIVARRYGFLSWPKLKSHVVQVSIPSKHVNDAAVMQAVNDLRDGKFCILFDDESRENEGDFVIAAEKVDSHAINFLMKHGRGTICLAITPKQSEKLGLSLVNPNSSSYIEPAFLASIDAAEGVTTGVSAADRACTIRLAISELASPKLIKTPGHVFPLRSHPKGLKGRCGHTEGSVELMNIAGMKPAAVICEILNDDGTMARWSDLTAIAVRYEVQMIRMSQLIAHGQ